MVKKEFAFLVDTSATNKILEKDNVFYVPIEVIIEKKDGPISLKDHDDISREEIENHIKNDVDLKSAQTPYGVVSEKMTELLQTYEKVICLPISKQLSGQYNSFCSVKKELEAYPEYKNRILVLDTLSLGILQDYLVEDVTTYLKKGFSFSEIESLVKETATKTCGATTITNATRLKKGGRLTGIKALLVKALNIKLIIKFKNGALEFADKKSNLEDSVVAICNVISKDLNLSTRRIKRLFIMSDLDDATTKKLNKLVVNELNLSEDAIISSKLPSCIILHLGINSYSVLVTIE